MKAFSSNASSERLQKRWDPEYHAAVNENQSDINRLEQEMDKDRALSLALEILSGLDGEAVKELRVLGRGRAEFIDRANVERGIKEDPFLGLCMVQASGSRMVARVEVDLASREASLASMREKLARVFQHDLPLEPTASRSSPRP